MARKPRPPRRDKGSPGAGPWRRPGKGTGKGLVRVIAFIVGLVFAGVLLISMISNAAGYFSNPPAPLASDVFHREPKALALSSDGPFGKFDKRQLQRGFQVYSEICSACHSLKLASLRDLMGRGYNDAEIREIASDW